jgi:hypothetical protein
VLILESQARLWLMVHAVLGAAVVAVTTHLVVWIRRYPRGEFGRHQGARWFATAALLVYGAQFAVGNLLYPAYKIRVRAEFLDLPSAARADAELRAEARREIDRRARGGEDGPRDPPPALASVARLFDVKEHWAALGLAAVVASWALAWAWEPKRDGGGGTSLFLASAIIAAACAWLAGLVGLWVSAARALGSP